MLFEIGFLVNFGRFWNPEWSQVGTKIGPKIDINFEERFFENRAHAIGGSTIFEDRGVEVGAQNRSKIDQKMESKMEGILASIFGRL